MVGCETCEAGKYSHTRGPRIWASVSDAHIVRDACTVRDADRVTDGDSCGVHYSWGGGMVMRIGSQMEIAA